ncbi:hypothetical protein AM588_10004214 [Phytophthora nicotianae]|uniref:Serine/threonine-protein phosphatase PGAM5, mitochondrial n=1 Tax=Phytophthora nicotianae TaxID=4792 RepID=A0A0W8D643_PHYNI|nr:hypothetical protein AM588_10004214 [Phytophthora nicotianae]
MAGPTMEVVSPAQAEDDMRPSHMHNSRLSTVNFYTPNSDGLGATQVLGGSQAPRQSLMASVMRPSSMMRPSVVTDLSNNFSEAKIHDAHVQVFASDVLMEGQLTKKGESGLQAWKNTLMDWMTAIAVAAEAHIVKPTSDLSLVDQSRTTHIILVRHGHYASSQTPSVDMHGPLTDLGVQQARATGRFLHKYLSERMVLKRFPKFPVYHSGVRRAVETAERIGDAFPSGSLEFRENKLFREAWPGNPLPNGNRQQLAREKLDNMVSDCARLKMAYRTMFRHLIPQDLEVNERQLSEEDLKHYANTFGIRSTQTRAKDRFRVVVCHANIIRWFVCKALGVDPDGTWGRMRYNHCGITAMEVDSVGNVQLTYMNQTGHLETTQLSEV